MPGDRYGADDAGIWYWILAVQNAIPDTRGAFAVAREYKRRGLPISVIVIDFFHWPKQGDWKFDPGYWPDPEAMVSELKEMGIELMVSVWPTVDKTSENYQEMLQKGFLVRTDRGIRITMDFLGDTVFYDATNPERGSYVWEKVKKNYYDNGIRFSGWMKPNRNIPYTTLIFIRYLLGAKCANRQYLPCYVR